MGRDFCDFHKKRGLFNDFRGNYVWEGRYMRKLEHSEHDVHDKASDKAVSRRSFLKSAAIGMGLIAGLQLGFRPGVAMAQDEYREVGGRQLRVIRLDRTLAEMDRDTAQYRDPAHEHMPGSTNNYVYSNDIVVPNEVSFIVSIDRNNDARRLVVRFPANRETNPNPPSPGVRVMNLNDFASYVRSLTGREMERVKFILESGTFQYNGNETRYTSMYMFPLDANGNILTRRGNGEFVVVDCSYYADQVNSGISLIAEPNRRDTIARNP